MKNKIIAIVLAICTLLGTSNIAAAQGSTSDKSTESIVRLMDRYKSREDFEVIKLGSFALSLFRAAARAEVEDEDDMIALSVLEGLKRMYVTDYSDTPTHVKKSFEKELGEILEKNELLMEAAEDGEVVRIYCSQTLDQKIIKQMIIHIPSEGGLICLEGNLSIDAVAELYQRESR